MSNTSIKLTPGHLGPSFRGMKNLSGASSYTLFSAQLEQTDNSVDANAKRDWTHVHTEGGYVTRLVNIDAGEAMSAEKTWASWQMAGDSKDRATDAIGKFHTGMKGAAYSTAKDITLVSKKGDAITLLHTDADKQYETNTFEPTDFVMNASRDELSKYLHQSDIDMLLALPSGTLFQTRHFVPEMVSRDEAAITGLKKAIGEAYPHLTDTTFFIQKDADPIVEIPRKDRFYHDTPSAVRFSYITKVRFYRPARMADPLRVIEEVIETREYTSGKSRGGAFATNFYEHFPTAKGMKFTAGMKLLKADEVEKLAPYLIGVAEAKMIHVTNEAYEAEQVEDPETNQKGFHLVRGKRKVSGALTFGNVFKDDESHNHRPRQRMQITFSPVLDTVFDIPWTKMVRDGPLSQPVVGHAFYRIFRQRGHEWQKQAAEEDRALKLATLAAQSLSETSESDSDETHVDVPMPPVPTTFMDILLSSTPTPTESGVRHRISMVPPSDGGGPQPGWTKHMTGADGSCVSLTPAAPPPSPPASPVRPEPILDLTADVRKLVALLSGASLGAPEATLLAALEAYLNA